MNRIVYLPRPMPHQIDVLRAVERHKVLLAGRRFGKTALSLVAAVGGHGPERSALPGALDGAKVAWVVPAYSSVVEVWRELKSAMRGAWTDKSETEHRVELPGGGVVLVRSGEDPDALRGFKFHGAVIDEAASQKEALWGQALAPALSDSQGWALFCGTPKGPANWFSRLYLSAEHLAGWRRWQLPSSANPLMTADELAARRREIGEFAFRREYLAEIAAASGGLFRLDTFRQYDRNGSRLVLDTRAVEFSELSIFATADLAGSTKAWGDYTVVAVWGATRDGHLVLLDVVRKKLEGAQLVPTLAAVVKAWNLSVIHVETGSFSTPIISQAREAGIPVRSLSSAGKDKVTRAEPAAALAEGGRVWLPRAAAWLEDVRGELAAFPDATTHDDFVDAFGYAVEVTRKRADLARDWSAWKPPEVAASSRRWSAPGGGLRFGGGEPSRFGR